MRPDKNLVYLPIAFKTHSNFSKQSLTSASFSLAHFILSTTLLRFESIGM